MIDLGSTPMGGETTREEDEEKGKDEVKKVRRKIYKNVEDLQSLSNINIYEMQMSKVVKWADTHTDVRKHTAEH